jgi:hypothetical protein
MVYRDIATTVFTPLELGTVGYSEEAAIEEYGSDQVECYASAFQPLEWALTARKPEVLSFHHHHSHLTISPITIIPVTIISITLILIIALSLLLLSITSTNHFQLI